MYTFRAKNSFFPRKTTYKKQVVYPVFSSANLHSRVLFTQTPYSIHKPKQHNKFHHPILFSLLSPRHFLTTTTLFLFLGQPTARNHAPRMKKFPASRNSSWPKATQKKHIAHGTAAAARSRCCTARREIYIELSTRARYPEALTRFYLSLSLSLHSSFFALRNILAGACLAFRLYIPREREIINGRFVVGGLGLAGFERRVMRCWVPPGGYCWVTRALVDLIGGQTVWLSRF